jgi:hypothetical protein
MIKLINAVHIKGLYYILNTGNLNLSSGVYLYTLTSNEINTKLNNLRIVIMRTIILSISYVL